ncbi:unnamed protein product [Heterotrigona itama]|uniref:Uncharacterized protein n=1 Tax=Heterotrigona itama TaxID=395501 RepID=A0A6V7H8S4_9HYME|nr:unnamed protein product [Heterotrigona itama]
MTHTVFSLGQCILLLKINIDINIIYYYIRLQLLIRKCVKLTQGTYECQLSFRNYVWSSRQSGKIYLSVTSELYIDKRKRTFAIIDLLVRIYEANVPFNCIIRAGWQRETKIPDHRRLQEFSNDQGRLCDPSLPRAGIPCPGFQVTPSRSVSFLDLFLDAGNAEPVGSVRPKFPSVSNINGLTMVTNGTLPFLCPAQGFPVPSYRYAFEIENYLFIYLNCERTEHGL